MKPVRKTDYFAVIPDPRAPGPALPKPLSDEAFHRRASSDFCLLVLIFTTTLFVIGVILNWSY